MQIEFPIEFLVQGTPVSAQAKLPTSRDQWKRRVRQASLPAIPSPHFASESRLAVTLYYFPPAPMAGDVDNIVKLTLDACARHIYIDDQQVERIVVQKFEPGNIFQFADPTPTLEAAMGSMKPVLYVRISDDPFEELQ